MKKAQRFRYGAAPDSGNLEPLKKPEGSIGVPPPPLWASLNAVLYEQGTTSSSLEAQGQYGGTCTVTSFI